MNEKYYLGLDVGTNSVGWAVTDVRYNLMKAPVKGKYRGRDMWGIRLFDKANTAEARRASRSLRRRLQRRKDRIKLLQNIFAEEMRKVDDTFFIRLNESQLQKDDTHKTTESLHPLFNDASYTDKQYYEDYPTIFHLRKELIDNKNSHDIRLVYLAIHNIIKYRGHFLIEGDFSADAKKSITMAFDELAVALDNYGLSLECADLEGFEKILFDNSLSKSEKSKKMQEVICLTYDMDGYSYDGFNPKKAIKSLSDILVGNQGDLSLIFVSLVSEETDEETKKNLKIKLSEATYEESQRDALANMFSEEIEGIDAIKAFYDWTRFSSIMGDNDYISSAKVNAYDRHNSNLKKLKALMKKYLAREDYNSFFHNQKDKSLSYSAYVGVSGKKKAPIEKMKNPDDFYKELLKKLSSIENIDNLSDEDRAILEELKQGADNHDLLPTLRNKDNGYIPRQINEMELKKILENAANYLPFLNDVDEKYGKSNIEKIISIFEYRIPYYVGPLSTRHKKSADAGRTAGGNVWIERRAGMENERIYPWNFDEVVDKEKSNEQFIRRMTNKCTYLTGEDVLPKNSLLYQKYMALNELNNLKIRNEDIEVSLKQRIYKDLFETGTRVTGKRLLAYLKKETAYGELAMNDLSGFDGDFKTVLSSEKYFKKVFDCDFLTDRQRQIAEDIICWKTIYGDDKTLLLKVVKKQYPKLGANELKEIKSLPKMSGWGNFSKLFLIGVFCEEMLCEETGEVISIIDALWNTNENLMQLLSNRFGYSRRINEINSERRNEITDFRYEECVEGLSTSPANKRAIWQALLIVEEIKKIMGCPPEKIFIEMARGDDKKKKGNRTTSRRDRLINLYKNCETDSREWSVLRQEDKTQMIGELQNREDRELSSKKLFLYYLQNGKCAYTGKAIDLEELMRGNSKWDIDHIFPQSKIDDDSFDNLVLVKKDENNKKSNGLISNAIQGRMKQTWEYWLKQGFITQKKYSRLTKTTDFTEKELSGFVARQIVETRQSTKLIADVLKQMNKESQIVYVKARLVSKFREEPLNVLKSRLINDYHHAKDAYLNIVVGDAYNTKYTDNPYKWMKENRDKNYSITKTMYWDIQNSAGEIVWKGCDKEEYIDEKGIKRKTYAKNANDEITGGDIDRIREIVKRDSCMYTEYTYCEKGELFNASQERKHSGAARISLKKNLDKYAYGGYKSANTSYFACIQYKNKGKTVKNIIGVPIYIDNMLKHKQNAFLEYCKEKLGTDDVEIINVKIKKNSLISVDGFPLRLRGENETNNMLKVNLQLRLDADNAETVRLMEKFFEKKKENPNLRISEQYDGLNGERLINLYDAFVNKFNTAYNKRPANQRTILSEKREFFITISLDDKVKVLSEIIKMLRCDASTTANLELIEGKKLVGNIALNKNTLGTSKINIIHQSVTGLFEQKESL